jgi:hypothetical protein
MTFLAIGILTLVLSGTALAQTDAVGAAPAPAAVDPAAYAPMDRERHAEVFAKWGAEGVQRIDQLRKTAAETVASSPECDSVTASNISDLRSAPPNRIVIVVECRNGTEYHLDPVDIELQRTAVSRTARREAISNFDVVRQCEVSTKAALQQPSSLERVRTSTGVYRDPDTGNRVVTFDFKSMAEGSEPVLQNARCVIDGQRMQPPEITRR